MNTTGQHVQMTRIREKKESIQCGSPRGKVPKVSEKSPLRSFFFFGFVWKKQLNQFRKMRSQASHEERDM